MQHIQSPAFISFDSSGTFQPVEFTDYLSVLGEGGIVVIGNPGPVSFDHGLDKVKPVGSGRRVGVRLSLGQVVSDKFHVPDLPLLQEQKVLGIKIRKQLSLVGGENSVKGILDQLLHLLFIGGSGILGENRYIDQQKKDKAEVFHGDSGLECVWQFSLGFWF